MKIIRVQFGRVRWNREKLPTINNLVFVETKYADKLDTEGPGFLDSSIQSTIERKLCVIRDKDN